MKRRTFLATPLAFAAAPSIPIIDTHIHLFDVSRPQGVPWPPKDSPIYKTALPDRLRKLAAPHGVVGAIEIECSPWLEDNQWVLDVAAKDPIIVGTIGDLDPLDPAFPTHLERFHKNPLFRGVRNGNLWDRDLTAALDKPILLDNLKLLTSAGLVLDVANPDPALMHAVVRLSDRLPNLTRHPRPSPGPRLARADAASPAKRRDADLHLLAQRHTFGKISGVARRIDGRVPLDLAFYRDRLDHIWDIFGPDRLMYGSDWPNSELFVQYPDAFRLAHEFISTKDRATQEKFFWKNSIKA